ncbi:MAG: IS3 family transposase [Eggerthellaceae bacterium]|nr:IS3 family transposase [Eggerthellaceae bacterium]
MHRSFEFFRGQRFPDYDTFKAELDEYITYWNTGRYQECLDGMTPEAFRLAGGRRGR